MKSYTGITQHDEAIGLLLEGKEKPHVIAVIEGDRKVLKNPVIIKDKGETHTYILNENWIEGHNAKNNIDHKQSMHFYIREDMLNAAKVNLATVTVPKSTIFTKDSKFTVGHIRFDTRTTPYSLLIPHIPNKYIATKDSCIETNKAFECYAKILKSAGRVLVGYVGDTNYKMMIQTCGSLATGGNVAGKYYSPTSSGANEHTFFMQAVAFDSGTRMTQPHTLNHINFDIKGSNIGVDHPSAQTTIQLPEKIKNRIYNKEIDPNFENAKEDADEENNAEYSSSPSC